jgi:hypothetical protein
VQAGGGPLDLGNTMRGMARTPTLRFGLFPATLDRAVRQGHLEFGDAGGCDIGSVLVTSVGTIMVRYRSAN